MFLDRDDAARQLCGRLEAFSGDETVVVGLARGGVVLAYRIAMELNADLGIVIVRKLGAPFNRELAIGAICDGKYPHVYLNRPLIEDLGIGDHLVQREIEAQAMELRRREAAYARHLPAPPLGNKTVIITDDGIATGATVRVAIEAVRQNQPRRCVLAVPVASPAALDTLEPLVDDLVCLHSPAAFHAVGLYYENFEQVEDAALIELLERWRREHPKLG